MLKIGGLEFIYTENSISKNIEYDNLSKFIREEFLKNKQECETEKDLDFKLCEKLEKLKIIEKEKEEEYCIRQKQVTTYLECRKSFFGRIRYFFKGNKKLKDQKENPQSLQDDQEHEEKDDDLIYDDKEYYTIEDLINITKLLERTQNEIRNTNQDIKAKEAVIERLDKRINNAKSYIEEIEEHKKSIFEFWKFVNKDNVLRLRCARKRRRDS